MKKLFIITDILRNLNYLSEILPFFFCILFLKKINNKETKVFFVYIIIAILFFIISFIASKAPTVKYSIISISIFLVLEFITISILYFFILRNDKLKKLILVFIFLFTVLWLFNFVNSNLKVFDFTPVVIECLFFTMLIIYYFYEIMRYNFDTPLFQLPSFWISVGFLMYFSGNFFLFLFSKIKFNEPGFNNQYLVIVSIITILKNILLITAIFVNKNLTHTKSNSSIPSDLNLDIFHSLKNH